MAEIKRPDVSVEQILAQPAREMVAAESPKKELDPALAFGIVLFGNAVIGLAYLSVETAKSFGKGVRNLGQRAIGFAGSTANLIQGDRNDR